MAIKTDIRVDREYERQLGDSAKRIIPVKVIFLNNSFSFLSSKENRHKPLWKVWVTRVGSTDIISEWSDPETSTEINFTPSESKEYKILWDGKDLYENLVDTGNYEIHISTSGINEEENSMEDVVCFSIYDEGPNIVYQESDEEQSVANNLKATADYIRQQQDNQRLYEIMSQTLQIQQQLNFPR